MAQAEEIISVVKCFSLGKKDALIVVIPKKLGCVRGQRFLVKRDSHKRLIYEPLEALEDKKEALKIVC
jgi:hypothetical protein